MKYLGKITDDKDLVTKEYVDQAVAGGGGGGGSGTVTSVGITAGNGISVSGSPITTSGNMTVGHSNSVTAKTTQALYPIKFDAQGHITGSGTAVTIVTPAVYVTESGTTSNSWVYRLWSDGTYEAWRSYGFSNITVATASAGTYYNNSTGVKDLTVPQFPNNSNTGVTFAQGTENESTHSSGVYLYAIDKSSATGANSSVKFHFRAHASTSAGSCGIDVYIKGTYA